MFKPRGKEMGTDRKNGFERRSMDKPALMTSQAGARVERRLGNQTLKWSHMPAAAYGGFNPGARWLEFQFDGPWFRKPRTRED